MKTFGRVLIILTAFAIVMGMTYFTVSASGSSSADMPQFESSERPAPPSGQFEERSERQGESGGLIFGLIKNIIIVAVIVALIVFPKNLLQQKRRAVPVRIK